MAEIVICADRSVIRAGLAAMVPMPSTQVVGQVGSLQALETFLQTQQSDLVIIALASLGMAESEAVLQIVEGLPLVEMLAVVLLVEGGIEPAAREIAMQMMETGSISILGVAE